MFQVEGKINISKEEYMKIRAAEKNDINFISDLLKSMPLPCEDFKVHLNNFYVIEEKNNIIATAGYESCSSYALLRSFAVKQEYKGLGLAKKLYKTLEKKAKNENIKAFYLLTQTAVRYFEKLNFVCIEKNKTPESIKNTEQFKSICPNSAQLMYLDLLR